MNPDLLQRVTAYVQAARVLADAGIYVYRNIAEWVRTMHPGATDEELNATIEGVIADARAQRTLIAAERAELRQLPGWVEPTEG